MRRHKILDLPVRVDTPVTEFTARSIVMLFIYLAAATHAMAVGTGCGELKGNGVRAEAGIPGEVQEGAFRLIDGEPVAFFDLNDQRVFGALSIVRFGRGYEALWRPISGAPVYLLVLNGTHRASLMFRRDAHWTTPYPLGTVVGPLTVTSGSGVTGRTLSGKFCSGPACAG